MNRVVRAGAARHRLSTLVVSLVVLASTAMLVLGIGLLTAANAPFDRSFAAQRGAHATVFFDTTAITDTAVRGTASRPGVVAAAGPYAAATMDLAFVRDRNLRLQPMTVAGRSTMDGPVDALHLDSGRWVGGPGEIVLSREIGGPRFPLGEQLTDGTATLTVVGVASSITRTADAWVAPEQLTGSSSAQMLYRFDSAGDESAVAASVASVTAGLPAEAVLGIGSYLTVRQGNDQSAAAATPFVVAFAILGMVVSILIVANVVSGAVLSEYRGIGVLKAIGCTPAQVVAVFAGRMLLPAAAGGAVGLVAGNLLALPVLNQAAKAYQVATVTVPAWANVVAVAAVVLAVGAAAVVPALRAGRMPATRALTLGRAPQVDRGRGARRLLARARLPRPVSLGLGTPFARPARTTGALVAIALGAATLVLATGLWTSLSRVADGVNRAAAAPVRVFFSERSGSPADPSTVETLLLGTPGTAHVTGVYTGSATVVGLAGTVPLTGYQGDSSWTGYRLISGRWYTSDGEAVVPSYLLTATGKRVGDTLTLRVGDRLRTVRVVGEIFLVEDGGLRVLTDSAVVTALDPRARVEGFEVSLAAGTDAASYVSRVNSQLSGGSAFQENAEEDTITLFLGLIVMLVLLVTAIAALGVFNTTLLNTREQVRDIGILKAVGMTPRQVRAMVVSGLAGLGAVAGALATPLGVLLHREVLQAMARAGGTGLPAEFVIVYGPAGLTVLAATGLVIAVAGALVPAGWAARARPATALRAE
jgi:putative ABC transport system permease protein